MRKILRTEADNMQTKNRTMICMDDNLKTQNGKKRLTGESNLFRLFSKLHKNTSPFTPNRRLYVILLICSLLIICSCVFIPQQCCLFTILSGIGCGGLASAVIAWLIDEANAWH